MAFENIARKGENVGNHHFSFSLYVFYTIEDINHHLNYIKIVVWKYSHLD